MRILTISAVALTALGVTVAAQAQSTKLFFEGDIVVGAPGTSDDCVLRNQFKRNEKVVWRVRVLDASGKSLDSKALKSLEVQLPDGEKFAMRYGPHPPPRIGPAEDFFWAAGWTIPESYPSGTFAYKVIATDLQGQTHSWEPFKRKTSQLQVIAGKVDKPKQQPKKK
jgi:hypothetical protein